MRNLFLLAFLVPASLWAFQSNNSVTPKKSGSTVTLNCRIYSVGPNQDSMYLFENMGLASRVIARAGRSGPDSAYVLTIPASEPKIYLVGTNIQTTKQIILGAEKEITIWGNSAYMYKARTVDSDANTAFDKLSAQIDEMVNQAREFRSMYNLSKGTTQENAKSQLLAFGKTKSRLLDSLKTANPLLFRYASLKLIPDYTGQGVETEFYAKEYFSNADLKNKAYEDIPEVNYAFQQYVSELLNFSIPHETVVGYAEAQLAKIPTNSRTYRMALGGIVSSLKNSQSAQYPTVAKKYIDLYRNSNLGEIPTLEMEVRKAGTYLTGFEAPDLAGMTPDSSNYSLKQMRGKVVMIDFWASWCGPCRKENPNVVENYNKYKDKGFDILGVSLDRSMDAWKKAIEADGLPWHHISDLKGWQSSHAALYSVTSIPQTLLVDRDGKIIARNLRGEQLGAKLAEIFGM